MNIYIGENIKRLRKEKNLTQEALADFIGISFQAISKWENNDAFPDITLLPVIANYFKVTIDELLGNDKIKGEERIKEYLKGFDRLHKEAYQLGDPNGGIEICKQKTALAYQAYKEYPYDWRIIHMLINALTDGYENEQALKDSMPLLAKLCTMTVEGCINEEFRQNAIEAMAWVSEGEEEEKWFNLMNDEIYNLRREKKLHKYLYYKKPGAEKLVQDNLFAYLGYIIMTMTYSGYYRSKKEQIIIYKKSIDLINLFFGDGKYGYCTLFVASNCTSIAQLYFELGDKENGYDYFERSIELFGKYNNLPEELSYTSPFFNLLTYKNPHTDMGDMLNPANPLSYLNMLRDNHAYDCIRDDERFKVSVKRLEDACK